MKNIKRWLCIGSVVCLLISSLMASASGIEHIDMGTMVNSNKIPILTLMPGENPGQVGYGGSEQFGYEGPDAFAVEDGVVYILDALNNRISVYSNGRYSDIDISECPRANHMKYQDGKLGVVDNDRGVTGIYTTAGTLVTLISHPETIVNEYVAGLVEIGDSYVVWKTYEENYYRYDWNENELMRTENTLQSFNANGTLENISNERIDNVWQINKENKLITMQGIHEDALVYYQYDVVPDVDMFFMELSVRKVTSSGQETYAIIDFSDWHASALEPFYLSTDGKVYVMECLEECTVISEVVLGTTDISRMSELEALAEARREEAELLEANAETNAIPSDNTYTTSRAEALQRAAAMASVNWTVKTEHKVAPTGFEGVVFVPFSVSHTTPGYTYTGIPYCWGGYNGYDSYGSGSFTSKLAAGGYTAGNICSDYGKLVPGTIGLDCSGFVACAYKFSTKTKPGTGDFASFGHAVSTDSVQQMDFFVYSGKHIFLYNKMADGKMVTYESHAFDYSEHYKDYTDGKVERFERTVSELSGYTARSPF